MISRGSGPWFWTLLAVGSVLRLTHGAAIASGNITSIPPYLKVCHRSDPYLQECLRDSINSLLRNIKNGSQGLGLVPLDPLDVPVLELNQGGGNASVHFLFTDVCFKGLSNTSVLSVKANVEENKLEITTKVPHLDVMGHYEAEGGVLSFPISARGNFYVNTTDVVLVLIVYYIQTDRHLDVERLSIDLIPSGITYDFDKYLDGDNKLGDAVNAFLNDNSHEVFSALKPRVVEMLGSVMTDVTASVLWNLPAEALLPE